MEYFDIFGLAPAFDIDLAALKQSYYKVSRDVHPDRHTLSTHGEQAGALDRSAIVNQAYKTLKDEDARMHYILSQHDLLNDDAKTAIPQDFLMEMMEVNEALMDLKMGDAAVSIADIHQQMQDIEADLRAGVTPAMLAYDETQEEATLPTVLDYYLKRKYLARVKEQLKEA